MNSPPFQRVQIDIPNSFEELSAGVDFEDITNGRKGTILVACNNHRIPIVRTTTQYEAPAQIFRPIHHYLASLIGKPFNNVLTEIYDGSYRKMGFHTDQSLDLDPESWICLFSCYENASNNRADIRKLIVFDKTTGEQSEVLLEHNTAVLFSTATNRTHRHKIVLNSPHESRNRWLGLTFRQSKTFIIFDEDGVPVFADTSEPLRLANSTERREFFKHKSQENATNGIYSYPDIGYTISESDLIAVDFTPEA